MKNHKFIKLTGCNDVKNLHISIDSIQCVFKSLWDWVGIKDKSTDEGYNFIQLKSGSTFEIEESPDDVLKLIQ